MALTLTYNGSAISVLPGSNTAGDILKLGNGTQRITLTYAVHNAALGWEFDQLEYSANGGSTWALVAYARDTFRVTYVGTDTATWGAALTMPTYGASQITLQMSVTASGTIGGQSGTHQALITAKTANNAVEIAYSFAMAATLSLSANQYLTASGPCYWSAGFGENCLALYNMACSPFANPRATGLCLSGQLRTTNKQTSRVNNVARSYATGMAMYTSAGYLLSFFQSPAITQSFASNATASSILAGNQEWLWQFRATNFSSMKNIDLAWRNQHDNSSSAVRPGGSWGNTASGITVPVAVSQTDPATTIQCTYAIGVDVPSQTGGSKLPIPVYLMPQAINKWLDVCYPRPAIGDGSLTQSGLWYQTPAALTSLISPWLQSTFSTYFNATYGYQELLSNNTVCYNYSNALALQHVTRQLQTGYTFYGTTDATAMADLLATVILNYQNVSNVSAHYGAIYKVRNLTPNSFTCQDTTHAANADQPHVSSYAMTEAVYALIGYFLARGNQTLTTVNGSTSVAASLDLACTYWSTVLQSEGGFLVEYSNTNTYTSANARIGAKYPGSVSVEIAANLLHWSMISPTATTTQKNLWSQIAYRVSEYWMTSESASHGCYEHGEDYVNHSAHACKMLMRGFMRLYQLTGSGRYQEWMAYYAEYFVLLCKRIDETINNSATNNQVLHTGGMVGTIDNSGVEAGESSATWALVASDILKYHPGPLPYYYYYVWAQLSQNLWAHRDSVTFATGSPTSWTFASPNTSASGFGNNFFDNTRFSYLGLSGALLLFAYDSLARGDNALVGVFCLNANTLSATTGRTILLANPQSTSQSVNVTVRGQAGKSAMQDGVPIAATISGSDLLIGPLTLIAGQVSKVVVQ